MELKYGLLFWLVGVMLIGNPPMMAVEGLECSICKRMGELGSKECPRMPCNTDADKVAADNAIEQVDGEMKRVSKRGRNRKLRSATSLDDNTLGSVDSSNNTINVQDNNSSQRLNCAKMLSVYLFDLRGRRKLRVPFTLSICSGLDARLPPKAEPYTRLPEGVSFGDDLELREMYICDESTPDNCQVSQEELFRSEPLGGVSSIGASVTVTTVISSCLLANQLH